MGQRDNRLGTLYARLYTELVRRAEAQLRSDRGAGLGPSTVVHEAWIRMANRPQVAETSTDHFLAIASRQMKLIRIDAARARKAQRRSAREEPLREGSSSCSTRVEERLHWRHALHELDEIKPRLRVVAERYLVQGHTVREVARCLAVSESVVDRDLRFVRAFLREKLAQ